MPLILDIDVGNPDTRNMPDISGPERARAMARLFGSCSTPASPQPAIPASDEQMPTCTEAAHAAADPAALSTGSLAEVQTAVLRIIAGGLRRPIEEIADGPDGEAGDVELDSMIAVFACSVIADVLGPEGMNRLRGNCEPDDFTSARSVAQLVCRLRRVVVSP